MPTNVPSLPASAQPILTTSAITSPISVASPVQIPGYPSPDAYGEYNAAIEAIAPANATYGDGLVGGYRLLTGGADPDLSIGCFAARCLAARVAAHQKPTYGLGAMDIWRLLVQNGLDVAKTVAEAGS